MSNASTCSKLWQITELSATAWQFAPISFSPLLTRGQHNGSMRRVSGRWKSSDNRNNVKRSTTVESAQCFRKTGRSRKSPEGFVRAWREVTIWDVRINWTNVSSESLKYSKADKRPLPCTKAPKKCLARISAISFVPQLNTWHELRGKTFVNLDILRRKIKNWNMGEARMKITWTPMKKCAVSRTQKPIKLYMLISLTGWVPNFCKPCARPVPLIHSFDLLVFIRN